YDKTAEADNQIISRVGELAKKHGVPQAQIALAWMLTKPAVTAPIIGATKMKHLDDAVAALDVKLAADEITYLEELYIPHNVAGFA
ncbi:MAG: aldo/keto reductase, partial [Alphaproteobacteria bacterium]|nr:aldo/keto reductase [Alphaproteobacteria bacterium]